MLNRVLNRRPEEWAAPRDPKVADAVRRVRDTFGRDSQPYRLLDEWLEAWKAWQPVLALEFVEPVLGGDAAIRDYLAAKERGSEADQTDAFWLARAIRAGDEIHGELQMFSAVTPDLTEDEYLRRLRAALRLTAASFTNLVSIVVKAPALVARDLGPGDAGSFDDEGGGTIVINRSYLTEAHFGEALATVVHEATHFAQFEMSKGRVRMPAAVKGWSDAVVRNYRRYIRVSNPKYPTQTVEADAFGTEAVARLRLAMLSAGLTEHRELGWRRRRRPRA